MPQTHTQTHIPVISQPPYFLSLLLSQHPTYWSATPQKSVLPAHSIQGGEAPVCWMLGNPDNGTTKRGSIWTNINPLLRKVCLDTPNTSQLETNLNPEEECEVSVWGANLGYILIVFLKLCLFTLINDSKQNYFRFLGSHQLSVHGSGNLVCICLFSVRISDNV